MSLINYCLIDLVVSNKDEMIANELRDILKVAAENRPSLRSQSSYPARSDTSSSLSSRSTTKSSIKQSKTKATANGISKPDVIITTNGGKVLNLHTHTQDIVALYFILY